MPRTRKSARLGDKMKKIEQNFDDVSDRMEKLSLRPAASNLTGLAYNPEMLNHVCPWELHIENPSRLTRTVERLQKHGLWEKCTILNGRKATKEELRLIHTDAWIQLVESSQFMTDSDLKALAEKFDSVYICKESFSAACTAAGCGIDLLNRVARNELRNGIALLRPPGHHAESDWTSGYCLFNNIAISAKFALDHLRVKRVLIVDWDVHHGQGTQDLFYNDPRVLYFSVHRYEHGVFWPHLRRSSFDCTGSESASGYNVNLPLNKKGAGNADYLAIWLRLLLPIAIEFDPDLVLVSAGFDAVSGDPKGEMELAPEMFAHLTHLLKLLANGKIILFFEGGYRYNKTAECVENCLRILLGQSVPKLSRIGAPDESHVSRNPFNPPEVATEAKIAVTELEPEVFGGCIREGSAGTCLVYDEKMMEHRCKTDHPEKPERIKRIKTRLDTEGLTERCREIRSRKATVEELTFVHGEGYVKTLEKTRGPDKKANAFRKKLESEYNSVFLSDASYECALLSAGSLLAVVDEVCSGHSRNGVGIIRPPGHHAEESEASGFCLFNNVAIAARYAQKIHDRKRILILDWDVHHGNGVQEMFYEDPDVLYVSLHRYDGGYFFPVHGRKCYRNVGEGRGEGFNLNIPWSGAMMGDSEYLMAFLHLVLPVAYEFAPDFVLVCAGFDAAEGDQLGNYHLTPPLYALLTHLVCGLSEGNVILTLEGGYNLDSISRSMSACVGALLGDSIPRQNLQLGDCNAKAWNTLRTVVQRLGDYWKSLRGYDVVLEPYVLPVIPDKGKAYVKEGARMSEQTPNKDDGVKKSKKEEAGSAGKGSGATVLWTKQLQTDTEQGGTQQSQETGLIFDLRMLEHRCIWDSHIEKPERLERILRKCDEYGLIERCLILEPRMADPRTEVTLCHSQELICRLERSRGMNDTELEQMAAEFEDIYLCRESYELALLSAGCALQAVSAVLDNRCRNAMAFIRPPGHHASRTESCGFCLFNNVAICARRALEKFGLKRVMIVDWDVHAGHGTESEFEDDDRVLFVSIHRYQNGKFWPNLRESNWDSVGKGAGFGYTVNIPINTVGCGDAEYILAFNHLVIPLAEEFNPELILISCGFDASVGDPEGEMKLTPGAYAHMTRSLGAFAKGRICAILEGGYFLDSLEEGAAWTLRSLLGDSLPPLRNIECVDPEFAQTLRNLAGKLETVWNSCGNWRSSVNLARKLLGSVLHETPDAADYSGQREVPIPYPTRNQYPSRPENVEVEFKRELKEITDTYRIRNVSEKLKAFHNLEFSERHFDRCKDSVESPERLKCILRILRKQKAVSDGNIVETKRVPTEEDLLIVHSKEHVERVKSLDDGWHWGHDAEKHPSYACKDTYAAAQTAIGCCLEAVDHVMSDKVQSGVALVRPPGHHAGRSSIDGFCFFNNAAVAAQYAKRAHGLGKILILDWDIHFGDGTADIFSEDPSVLYVSLHRWGNEFYPWSCDTSIGNVGKGPGEGLTLSLGWKEGNKTDSDYFFAFEHVVLPVCQEFNPELVLVSAGFDAGEGDPLGECNVSSNLFAYMTWRISALANGRVVVILEGGYNHDAVRKGMLACVRALSGMSSSCSCELSAPVSADAIETVGRVLAHQKNNWKCLESAVFDVHMDGDDVASGSLATTHSSIAEFLGLPTNAAEDAAEMYAVYPLPYCPHLSEVTPVPCEGINVSDPCSGCGNVGENWICLTCYEVHCGRFVNMHGVIHATEKEHSIALSFADLSVWCYICDSYVHNPVIAPAKEAAHRNKFGVGIGHDTL